MTDSRREAAVGLLVKDGSILLIKRIEREGDPWSGHIALPGGFAKSGESMDRTVVREIQEETSLSMAGRDLVRSLPVVHPVNKHEVTVHPFLFSPGSFDGASPGPEVEEIRIVRLSDLRQKNRYFRGMFDAFLAGDWIVWGLTYRILTIYFSEIASKQ